MESSKITIQILSDENLLLMGMIIAIFGFYAIAEWEIITGLIIVFSGYGAIITTTKIGKKTCKFIISKSLDFLELIKKNI